MGTHGPKGPLRATRKLISLKFHRFWKLIVPPKDIPTMLFYVPLFVVTCEIGPGLPSAFPNSPATAEHFSHTLCGSARCCCRSSSDRRENVGNQCQTNVISPSGYPTAVLFGYYCSSWLICPASLLFVCGARRRWSHELWAHPSACWRIFHMNLSSKC